MNIFETRELEQKIRSESEDDLINLVLRHVKVDLYDRWGLAYLEFAELEESPNTESLGIIVEKFLEEKFNTREHLYLNNDITFRNGEYHVLVELAGTEFFTEPEHTQLQKSLSELTDHPVVLYVRSKPEVVVTKNGNISFEKLKGQMLQQMKKMHSDQLENISKETL